MTPSETKLAKMAVTPELETLRDLLIAQKVPNGREIRFLIEQANLTLKIFCKDQPILGDIKIRTKVPDREIVKGMKKSGGSSTMRVSPSGETEWIVTKEARNTEIPSIATEMGCLQILVNSIRQIRPYFHFTINGGYSSPSHLRAFKIVTMAHKRNNWVIPSMVDINVRSQRPIVEYSPKKC